MAGGLGQADIPWLAGSIISGGIGAPVLLMTSLRVTPAATASLLLNFESVATTILAISIFHESVGRRVFWAIGLITAGAVIMSFIANGEWGVSIGALGIIGSTVLWGIDNNLTRRIAAKDPVMIGMIKGIISGAFTLALALISSAQVPPVTTMLEALLLGSFSYGVALAMFIAALRSLGASRTSALFGTAPFWGALLSFIIFREIQWMFFLSLPLMAAGTFLLLGEKREVY